MSEINLWDEELDRYVIGFTENQYLPADSASPPPSDHSASYTSFAQDFAERSNRGTLKNFLDQSCNLDKQKRQSVSKIHTNILDLMFELSERRKIATPQLSKSAMELYRSDSSFSDESDASLKTSSSLPLIAVQQLPPLLQSQNSAPSLSHEDFQFPDVTRCESVKKKNKNKSNKRKGNSNKGQLDTKGPNYNPKLAEIVVQVIEKHQIKNRHRGQSEEIDSKNVRFTIGTDNGDQVNDELNQSEQSNIKTDRFKTITDKILEARKLVRERGDKFNEYKGRYYSTHASAGRKTSFCQSSYKERADKARMDNIRRRHSSQTKVGPLDFNKLRRQITLGRMRTMFC